MTLPPLSKTGDMIDAVWLNLYVRDNLVLAGAHAHDGGVMKGATALDGVTQMKMTKVADQSEPAPGHTVFWASTGGTMKFFAEGGSVKTISETTHTH